MSTFKSFGKKLLFCLFIIQLLVISGLAQSVTGSVTGIVTDSNGGVVPNAKVTLVSVQVGNQRNVNTNEDGRFSFVAVQPGAYTVKIEHQGFQTLLRQNTVLSANENLALGELMLTTGNVNETVTVQGEGATVETETSDLTARLTSDQIDLISTKGRDI